MAEYSLQDFWWNKPSRTESQLPALQLGVQIVQRKAQQDLQERDLANDIARTSLMRDEMLAKQKIQTMLVAGNAEMASAISEVNDWTDEEQVSRVWATGARNPMTVGGKAWLGAQHMVESARTAKRLEEESKSRIEARQDRTELNRLAEERRALLTDSTIDVNDSRIVKNFRDTALEERRLLVQEGNLGLRGREIEGKETRLGLRERYLNERNAVDREEKAKLKDAELDPAESDRLRKFYNLKRREVTKKFYGPEVRPGLKTEDRMTNAPPAVVAPAGATTSDAMPQFPVMPSRKEDLKVDEVYITPRGPALWDGEKFIPQ